MKGIRRLASGWFRRSQERTLRILADPDADASSLRLPGLSATWLREFIQYDPGHDLARVGCPVLAITGAKDIQVEASDVSRIGALVENGFTGLTPESITHLLRTDPGPVGLKSYRAQMRRPIDPDLLATITSWVTADRAI
jgi:fermentation-respiration switch protein FrsA (DUF1100 family)